MKIIKYLGLSLLMISLINCSETDTGEKIYGEYTEPSEVIEATAVLASMGDATEKTCSVRGKIATVCQKMGCWVELEMNDGKTLFVEFKDHGFAVPKDSEGSEAIVSGKLVKKVRSVEELRHMAEDAGKTPDEITSITEPEEEIVFIADGAKLKKDTEAKPKSVQ